MVGLMPGGEIAVSGDAIALPFVVAGLLLLAFVAGVRVSRRPADVLDLIEPPLIVPDAPGALIIFDCCCSARLPSCLCAVDGVRNPRGAGRGRCCRPLPLPLPLPLPRKRCPNSSSTS
jgi:hypothetical protein